MRHVTLITTGGTIEKTYDEMTGELANRRSVVRRMLAGSASKIPRFRPSNCSAKTACT